MFVSVDKGLFKIKSSPTNKMISHNKSKCRCVTSFQFPQIFKPF